MLTPQYILDLRPELIVDLFAGGGGMSTAIEQATGLYPDIACNHDAEAISMHEANHPQTRHYRADVFELCPKFATGGRPVGLLHASPDCTHHSQAAGGQPRNRKIRALSWAVARWAGQAAPRVITLENVKQITQWGPLVAKRCKTTGRVIKTDGSVAAPSEVVPIGQQYLVPNPKKAGRTWRRFVRTLEQMGYTVEWRILVAADYGAPTTRERLFMCARRDGQPITWPQPTHFRQPEKGQQRWRSAAECIDWDIPGKSIFDRPKPLAEATLRRIAKGIKRFVLDNPQPYIIPGGHNATAPITIQAAHGEGSGKTKRRSIGSKHIRAPLGTVTASGRGGHAVATAYMMQANGGFYDGAGRSLHEPASTITNSGSQQQLVSACLMRQFGSSTAADIRQPVGTITTDGAGGKTGLITCRMGNAQAQALRVAAFLINYYGNGDARDITAPLDTITTRDRLALVTVHINNQPYYITDITLRMLEPHELYKAQGFPADYIITHGHDGQPLSKTAQVRMCGNSVSPPPAAALIKANYQPIPAQSHQAA